MKYQNGRVYEGEWEHDKRHGRGYELYANGNIYQGEFQDGKAHGKGKYEWIQQKEIYDGEWSRGIRHGYGVWKKINLKNPTGPCDSYIGEWKKGKAEGFGVHTWSNGDKFEGEWKQCMKHGKGTDFFANGDKYTGQYKQGKPDGKGIYTWSNGSFYEGYFKDGLKSGKGKWKKYINQNNSTTISPIKDEGSLINQSPSQDQLQQRQCLLYEGEYLNDKKHGYGVFTWATGNIYRGEYKDDERDGHGEMKWTDGSYYIGQWVRGIQHGYGKIVFPDGTEKEGYFENNIFIGPLPREGFQNPKPLSFKEVQQKKMILSPSSLAKVTPQSFSKKINEEEVSSSPKNRKAFMEKRRSKTNSVDRGTNQKKYGTPKNISRIEEENEQSQISSGRIRSAKRSSNNQSQTIELQKINQKGLKKNQSFDESPDQIPKFRRTQQQRGRAGGEGTSQKSLYHSRSQYSFLQNQPSSQNKQQLQNYQQTFQTQNSSKGSFVSNQKEKVNDVSVGGVQSMNTINKTQSLFQNTTSVKTLPQFNQQAKVMMNGNGKIHPIQSNQNLNKQPLLNSVSQQNLQNLISTKSNYLQQVRQTAVRQQQQILSSQQQQQQQTYQHTPSTSSRQQMGQTTSSQQSTSGFLQQQRQTNMNHMFQQKRTSKHKELARTGSLSSLQRGQGGNKGKNGAAMQQQMIRPDSAFLSRGSNSIQRVK